MSRIEAVFPLNGNLNKYSFDTYESKMWMLMTIPPATNKTQVSQAPENQPPATPDSEQLAVGAASLQRNTPIPLSLEVSAKIPRITFTGSVVRNQRTQVTGIDVILRRSDHLIVVSLLINAMMAGLAVSVLAMVLPVTTAKQSDLLPLSVSSSLIFGLPALRNVQPGVPTLGALSDYVIFIWAELIVAVSAVVTVWHSLLLPRSKSES
jgi:hypothetical protein